MTRSSARTAASCRRTASNGRSPSRRARTRPGPRRAGSPEHCQERTGRPSSCAAIWPVTWTARRSRRPGRICSRPWRRTKPSSGCWTWCRRSRTAPHSPAWVSCLGRWGCPWKSVRPETQSRPAASGLRHRELTRPPGVSSSGRAAAACRLPAPAVRQMRRPRDGGCVTLRPSAAPPP